jgi:DNA invertase Pin-like site-specific DNA recombinase
MARLALGVGERAVASRLAARQGKLGPADKPDPEADAVARPRFDRLLGLLYADKVGTVLCSDVSRLARNGRDWHHLLELCGMVEARVIDTDGVYDPGRPNDRLLLGMKGSISEFGLSVLRARMLDARQSKARRGAHRETGLSLDPDRRLQEVVRSVFGRFRSLGSARQVLLSSPARIPDSMTTSLPRRSERSATGWRPHDQNLWARGQARASGSEYLRRERDLIIRTTAACSAARQITTATRALSLGTFAGVGTGEHGHFVLEGWQHNHRDEGSPRSGL